MACPVRVGCGRHGGDGINDAPAALADVGIAMGITQHADGRVQLGTADSYDPDALPGRTGPSLLGKDISPPPA